MLWIINYNSRRINDKFKNDSIIAIKAPVRISPNK